MESLDQVFLKAYAKQTIALTDLPDPPEVKPGLEAKTPSSDAATEPPETRPGGSEKRETTEAVESCVRANRRRMDPAHTTGDNATGPPHTSFSVPEAKPCSAPDAKSQDASSDAARGPDAKATASISMLKLATPPPSTEELDVGDDFSPDWELDRFVWPDLCLHLLATEHRYFQLVGEQLKAATDQSHHVVMVSGCRRGEGRTTLALCLARSAAAAGVDVAVVDADWQNPQLGTRLGLEPPCGWTEVLAGKATLNEAAVTSVEDRLTLFPLNGPGSVPLASKQRRPSQVMRAISARFPLVIIDAGPWDDQDPLTVADDQDCLVDAAIVVRDLRRTEQEEAVRTARRLQANGITAVGIAENFESK
ncbi:MAG: hypothetical protein EA424_23635 [Planctomycetaceae bacterium]|nr:MAG: hypothetical protein EA424_23635 [Planctomycetaceae bacterium]